MQQNGNSQYTIDSTARHLKRLSQHCNLSEPENITAYISSLNISNGYKINLYTAYTRFAKHYNIPFEKPKLRVEQKAISLPTQEKLNAFINYARRGLALKLRISKYGLRPIEVVTLKAKDIDPEHKTISVTTAKHGAPRNINIDQPLAETLKIFIQKTHKQPNDYLFKKPEHDIPTTAMYFTKTFVAMRTRLAKVTNDPSIKGIKLYHFRHYFATMTQIKYKDVPTTAYMLGHRSWKNTQVYVNLAKILELGQDGDTYIVKTANTLKEYTDLLEQGFQYVSDYENLKVLRKRK